VDVGAEGGGVDGGGYGEEKLVVSEGGRVGGEGDVGPVGCGVEGGAVDEVGHRELVEGGEVGADLFPAAAG